MIQIATDSQIDYWRKTVLMRVDYNLPMSGGKIISDVRLRASLPSIQAALKAGARRVVLISHLGRPVGIDKKLSLKPMAKLLEKYLEEPVLFVEDWQSALPEALNKVTLAQKNNKKSLRSASETSPARIVLLENLRFDAREADNDLEFAQELVDKTGAELFIQDGFAVAHRRTATTDAITQLLPSYASENFAREYRLVGSFWQRAPRPCVAIVGGAKVSDKLGLLRKLAEQVDYLVIGGAMASTFLAHRGLKVGASLVETDQTVAIEQIYQIWARLTKPTSRIILPVDVKIATKLSQKTCRYKLVDEIKDKDMIGDLGQQTTQQIIDLIERAGSVIWNGNLGYTENPIFAQSSRAITEALVRYQPKTMIGGGDTVGFVEKITTDMDLPNIFLSTGGGASLELLTYGKLPGAEGLLNLSN